MADPVMQAAWPGFRLSCLLCVTKGLHDQCQQPDVQGAVIGRKEFMYTATGKFINCIEAGKLLAVVGMEWMLLWLCCTIGTAGQTLERSLES